ncbi:MAG: RNA methyltransferase, partial [Armatimonadetes bacterium]|nr:RNA methyltransferase [Armatimonadota bacterium]
MITSPRNPLIRSLRGLHQRRHRDETGRFLIEGLRLVETALEAEAPLEQILHTPALSR